MHGEYFPFGCMFSVLNSGLVELLAACFASVLLCILKKALEVNHRVSMGLREIYTAEVAASVWYALSLPLVQMSVIIFQD